MMYILDTNVISEIRKIRLGKAEKSVAQWADSVNATELYLSVITIQELEMGVLLAEHRDQTKGALLRDWLDNHVLPAFSGRILPVDTSIGIQSAKLKCRQSAPSKGWDDRGNRFGAWHDRCHSKHQRL
jgi:toxin FitB